MRLYDPAVSPNAEAWLALDEHERIDLVRDYHERRKIVLPHPELHVTTHVIIENQLAEGLPPAVDALARLMAAGLNRHDAVHTIGLAVIQHIYRLTKEPEPEGDPHEPYFVALDALTIDDWHNLAGP